jgi:DNA-binding NarL/FixJ family response regulator
MSHSAALPAMKSTSQEKPGLDQEDIVRCPLADSIYNEPTVVGQMLSAGISGFVHKRTAAADLIPAVKEAFRGGVYVCPALRALVSESETQAPTVTKSAPPVE